MKFKKTFGESSIPGMSTRYYKLEGAYKIDEKLRTTHLTDHGIGKIEKLYGISNIYESNTTICTLLQIHI